MFVNYSWNIVSNKHFLSYQLELLTEVGWRLVFSTLHLLFIWLNLSFIFTGYLIITCTNQQPSQANKLVEHVLEHDGHIGALPIPSPFSLYKMSKLVVIIVLFFTAASSSFALNLGKYNLNPSNIIHKWLSFRPCSNFGIWIIKSSCHFSTSTYNVSWKI